MIRAKQFLILIVVCMSFFYGYHTSSAQNSTILPEIDQPLTFKGDESFLYVVEGHRIYIYSKDNLQLIKKLGSSGEDSGEFISYSRNRKSISVDISSDTILVTSNQRLSLFDKSFRHLADIPVYEQTGYYMKAGDNFVCSNYVWDDNKPTTTEYLFTCTQDIDLLEMIYQSAEGGGRIRGFAPGKKNRFPLARHYFGFKTVDAKIFVGDTRKGFFISVLDQDGNPLYEIKHDYDTVPVPPVIQQVLLTEFDRHEVYKQYKEALDPVFPENSQAYEHFQINNGNIYAYTFKTSGDLREVIKMDIDGAIQDTLFIPYAKYSLILDDVHYFLKRNDLYEWEMVKDNLNENITDEILPE